MTEKQKGCYLLIIYLVVLSLGIISLLSCSAEYHLTKAIKKDPTLFKPKVDTVTLKVPEYIETVKGKDSVEIDNERVWIKVINSNDSITLDYKVKEVKIDTFIRCDVITDSSIDKLINNKNSRQKNRFEHKENVLKAKNDFKIKKIQEKAKIDPKSKKGFFRRIYYFIKTLFWYILVFCIGFVIGRIHNKFRLINIF